MPHFPDLSLGILGPALLRRISQLELIAKLSSKLFELPFDARGAEPCPANE